MIKLLIIIFVVLLVIVLTFLFMFTSILDKSLDVDSCIDEEGQKDNTENRDQSKIWKEQ